VEQNFDAFIAFVWPENGGFDSPKQGYHVTPGDSGGGTKGGVIEATWAAQVRQGEVTGTLTNASNAQLETVLRNVAWGPVCDALPAGVDLLVANGRMMTGAYGTILQQCLGLVGLAVDNDIGPETLAVALKADPVTLIHALHGNHYRYLAGLSSWAEFKNGWTTRLIAAVDAALAVAGTPAPVKTG
jgi:lysozyme family protein